MNKDGVEIEGLKEIEAILSRLPYEMHAKIVRDFNREAVRKHILPAMKEAAPSEKIAQNIKIKNDREDPTAVFVGPTNKVPETRWYELGTAERKDAKGRYRGKLNPKPFIQPTIDANYKKIIEYAATSYGERINKFLERNVKRINKKLGQ